LPGQLFQTTQEIEILQTKVIDRQAKNESYPATWPLFKTIATLFTLPVSLQAKIN